MFCKNCGRQIKPTDKFCTKCGYRILEEEVSPMQDDVTGSVNPADTHARDIYTQENVTVSYTEPVKEQSDTDSDSVSYTNGFSQQDASVEPSAAQQNVQDGYDPDATRPLSPEERTSYGYQIPEEPVKKKRHFGGIIAAVVAVVICIGVLGFGVFNASAIENFARKTFASPAEYYQYVEKKAVVANIEASKEAYQTLTAKKDEDKSISSSVKLELGNEAKSLLGTIGSYDLSWLDNMTVTTDIVTQGTSLFNMNIGILLGEDKLASLNAIMDADAQKIYMQVPELQQKYLSASISDVASNVTSMSADKAVDINELQKMLPDEQTYENIMKRYSGIIISCIDNVKKTSDTVTVEGISKKCTKLTATVDAATALKIKKAVLTQVKADKDIENIFTKSSELLDTVLQKHLEYKEFIQNVNAALENEESVDTEKSVTFCIWVDGKGEVIGRGFGEDEEDFSYKLLRKGKNLSVRAQFMDDDEKEYSFYGTGTQSGSVISGDFKVAVNNTDYATVTISDYDTKWLKDGKLKGSYKIAFTSEGSTAMFGTSMVSNYNLLLELGQDKDASSMKVSVLSGDQLFAAVTLTAKQGAAQDIAVPSEENVVNMEDSTAITGWMLSADWQGFISNLKNSALPSQIVDQLQSLIGMSE